MEPKELLEVVQGTDLVTCTKEEFDHYVQCVTELKKLPGTVLNDLMEDIPQEQPKLTWEQRVHEFRQMYLEGQPLDKPIVVACSWGKDSTVLLRVVQDGIMGLSPEKRTRQVYVITSDTRAENPKLRDYVYDQTDKLNVWAKENDLPMEAHILARLDEQSILFLLLGKGYPLPGATSTKWCTHKLKIEPQNRFMKKVDPAFLLVGTRLDESSLRKRTINKYRFSTDLVSYSPYNVGVKLWTGVVDMDINDIWETLSAPLPHSSSIYVRNLYAEATGECGLQNPEGATEYSNACSARFGCWLCPVVLKDKSTEVMAETHDWLYPLTLWRKRLLELFNDPQSRSGYKRDGKPSGHLKGCITLPVRKQLLQELLETQNRYNELRAEAGLSYDALVSENELQLIYNQWTEDEEKRPWLLDSKEYRPGDFSSAAAELEAKRQLKEAKKQAAAAQQGGN